MPWQEVSAPRAKIVSATGLLGPLAAERPYVPLLARGHVRSEFALDGAVVRAAGEVRVLVGIGAVVVELDLAVAIADVAPRTDSHCMVPGEPRSDRGTFVCEPRVREAREKTFGVEVAAVLRDTAQLSDGRGDVERGHRWFEASRGELPGGARLTAVEHDRVIVTDQKGTRRTITINSGTD